MSIKVRRRQTIAVEKRIHLPAVPRVGEFIVLDFLNEEVALYEVVEVRWSPDADTLLVVV